MSNPRLQQVKKSSSIGDRFGAFFGPVWRWLRKDKLSTGLLFASLILLASSSSSSARSGRRGAAKRSPSRPSPGWPKRKKCRPRKLLDYDHQIIVDTDHRAAVLLRLPGLRRGDPAAALRTDQSRGGSLGQPAVGQVDADHRRPVPAADPDPGLPVQLLHAPGGGRRGGRDRRLLGLRRQGQTAQEGSESADHLRLASRARAKRWPSCKEIRDFLDDPSKYTTMGAAAPKGVLLVGPPGHRQDAARAGDGGRGRRGLLLAPPAPSSSSPWSASARRASATSSPRRARRRRRSSSSTSSTPPGASAAPASARATTSASRR